MKTRLLLVVLLSLSTFTFAQSNAPIFSTRITGTSADDTFFINGSPAHISVSSNVNGGTLLLYNASFRNPDGSFTFMGGGGFIPDSAAILNNANVAHLNVDTSQVPGFFAFSCTFVPGQPGTCGPGPFGVIQADWQKDGVMSNRTINDDWKTFPGARLHTQLNSNTNSAHVEGSFLGNSFTSDLGDIGTVTDSLFEMFKDF
jgi:hypothetical protein